MPSTKRITKVVIKRMVDKSPGTSPLLSLGIRAEAEILISNAWSDHSFTVQKISSGGLWGIESDSEKSYFEDVAKGELSQLRQQLESIGFSKRVVSAAFRNVEHSEE